jgi:4-hydroxy-3-polyprenylbenzoate decarboxylase
MIYRSLADFLEALRESGELERFEAEVDPHGEAAEIARKTARESGKVVLFSSIRGHDMPVVANLFGTESRICRALGGKPLSDLAERVSQLISPPKNEGLIAKLIGSPQTNLLASIAPRLVKSGSCQQIVRLASDVDLFLLPLLRADSSEQERNIPAAPFLSAGIDSREAVSGRFDLQVLDRQRLAVCFAEYDEPARAWWEYRRRNEKMPLAVALGGDPAFMLATAASLPGKIDVCSLAGLLREKPLDVVACRTVALTVPAEADLVLEGYLDPQMPPVMAGPMLSPLGEPTPPRLAPVMHVTAMTQRASPVYPAVVHGKPPHELSAIARAMKQIFLPVMKVAIEELVDYDLPECAAGRLWATLSIRKSYAGQAQRVTQAAGALRPFWFAKWLVIVDEEIDVYDAPAVMAAMAANVNPSRDIWMQQIMSDSYDLTAVPGTVSQRVVIDATRK